MEAPGSISPWNPIKKVTKWSYPLVVGVVLLWVLVSCIGSFVFHRRRKGVEWGDMTHKLWHPIWSSLSPYTLLVTRCLSFLYVLGVQLAYIVWAKEGKGIFDYYQYTSWNWGLLALYFCIALGVSGREILTHNEAGFRSEGAFTTEMDLVANAALIIFEIVWPSVFVVCVTYWAILMPGAIIFGYPYDQDFFSIAHHTTNFFVLCIEFSLNSNPFHLGHIWLFLFWPALFCLFTLSFYGYRELWPYPIMDARTPEAVGWYSALWVGHVLCYCTCWGFHILKKRCAGVEEEPEEDPLIN